jgi:hypothetical protein
MVSAPSALHAEPPVAAQQKPDKGGADRHAATSGNLQRIGRAMHNYYSATGALPPAYKADRSGKPSLSWRVLLLPYLGCDDLYHQFHLDEPWDSEHNMPLVTKMPGIYRSAESTVGVQGKTGYLTVRGEKTVFPGGRCMRMANVTDGTANTIMAVEAPDQTAVVWTKPDDFQCDESNPISALVGAKADGFHAVFVDGRVRRISSSVDPKVLRGLFTRNGGEWQAAQYIFEMDKELRDRRHSSAMAPNALAGRDEPDMPDFPKAGNRMRQIWLAVRDYCAATHRYPPAFKADGNGQPLLSWRVVILPYLGRNDLYRRFHLDEPWDSRHNRQLVAEMPALFQSLISKLGGQGRTNYLTVRGDKTVFPGAKSVRVGDIPDGPTDTIVVVEVPDETAVVWTKPDDLKYDEDDPLRGLVAPKSSSFRAIFADGTVRFIASSVDPKSLRALFTRNGGETVLPKSYEKR